MRVERCLRRACRIRHDRPVDQREERKLVARRVEPDRLAGFERGALREEQRQPLQARLADVVDLGIAGDDVGEPRFDGHLLGEIVGGRIGRSSGRGLRRRRALRERVRRDERRGEEAEHERARHGAAARHQPVKPAGEPEHHQRVDHQQRQRRQEQRPAQVLRLAEPIGLEPRRERRVIERGEPVGRDQRVHGEQSLRWTIKSRRMVRCRAETVARRHGARRRGRRRERAEAVEHAVRRHGFARRLRFEPLGIHVRAGERDDALEHVDERARQRQVGPARIGGHMKQHDHALAAPRRGDQRRAVGERRPGAVGEPGVGLGQHLTRHRHVVRHRHGVERAFARERRELLRLLPRERAAERAPAAAQLHRNEIVVGGRKTRAREAHQHAALVDPFAEPLARLADIADVGKDQHRQVRIEELLDRLRGRAALGEPHVGERVERAREIDRSRRAAAARCRRSSRSPRRSSGGASACRAIAPRRPSARRKFRAARCRCGFRPADRTRFGLALVALERELRLAERQALRIERAHQADIVVLEARAQHLHGERAGRIVGGGRAHAPARRRLPRR